MKNSDTGGVRKEMEFREWLFLFWNMIIRNKTVVVPLPIVCSILFLLIAFVTPTKRVASVKILPASEQSKSSSIIGSLGAMAGSFGLGSTPHDIYPKLLKSYTLLVPVVSDTFQGEMVGDVLFGEEGSPRPPAEKIRLMARELSREVKIKEDIKTGMIEIQYRHTDPDLAIFITNRLVDQLSHYLDNQFISSAKDQREGIQSRLSALQDSLSRAEETLLLFSQENRDTKNSPNLKLDETRMVREIRILSSLMIEMNTQLERARTEEVASKPELNILDRPEAPLEVVWPKKKKLVLSGFLLGVLVALCFLFVREYLISEANV